MQQVVKILPRRALYRVNVSLYATYGGDFPLAEEAARTVAEMKSRWAWFTMALAQLGQGKVPEATQAYQELARVDALGVSQSISGLGDVAMYAGRYSDAIRILQAGAAAEIAAKNPDAAATKLAAVANAQLLRGDKRAAVEAAEEARKNSSAVKIRFMAAKVFVEVGDGKKAEALIAGLAKEPQAEPRAYAKILEGEMHLKGGDATAAIESFGAANSLLDTWIGHFDLGRAYLETREFLKADSEFDRCLKRRGEAVSLFLDEEPTFGVFPPVYYYRGRAREELKTAGFADSYRAYLSIRGNSTEDPLVRDVRRRVSN
jgi:tetratricopeptide (TPR) repeat protein